MINIHTMLNQGPELAELLMMASMRRNLPRMNMGHGYPTHDIIIKRKVSQTILFLEYISHLPSFK